MPFMTHGDGKMPYSTLDVSRRCYGAVLSLTTLATMRCQSTVSSEAMMSCVGFTLSFHDDTT